MSIYTIMDECLQNFPYIKDKEKLAEKIAERFLAEEPAARSLNTSTLRHFIFNVLSYNNLDDTALYRSCTTNSVQIPFLGTKTLTITTTDKGEVYKVCPICKMTAQVGDPFCPNCNHLYDEYEKEKVVVEAAIDSLLPKDTEKVSLTASQVILDDEEEGIRVTVGDVDRVMKNVKKYIPKK